MKPDDVVTPVKSAVESNSQVLDPREEPHLAAELLDLAADRLDDGRQAVAAEVRAVVVEDGRLARLLALALGEQFQHAQHVRPGAAAGQLAVGERAGAALAEEVVALGVERPAVVEGLHVADAVVDARAAFEHDRPVAVLGEEVRADEPARPGADDHGPVRQGTGPGSGIANGGSS